MTTSVETEATGSVAVGLIFFGPLIPHWVYSPHCTMRQRLPHREQHHYHMLNCPHHTLSLPLLLLLFIITIIWLQQSWRSRERGRQTQQMSWAAHDGCCSSLQGEKNKTTKAQINAAHPELASTGGAAERCCTISLAPSGRAKITPYIIRLPHTELLGFWGPKHAATSSPPYIYSWTPSPLYIVIYTHTHSHTSIRPARVHQAIIHQQGTDGVTDR